VPNEFKARKKITAGFKSILFWWPQSIKTLIGLIIFTITHKGLLTIPGMLSKEEQSNWDQASIRHGVG
jgi:hypothetical protein